MNSDEQSSDCEINSEEQSSPRQTVSDDRSSDHEINSDERSSDRQTMSMDELLPTVMHFENIKGLPQSYIVSGTSAFCDFGHTIIQKL